METNHQLTVSDLYNGEAPLLQCFHRPARFKELNYGRTTWFINFGHAKLYIPGCLWLDKPSISILALMQLCDNYHRLVPSAVTKKRKERLELEFKQKLSFYKIKLHRGDWYALESIQKRKG